HQTNICFQFGIQKSVAHKKMDSKTVAEFSYVDPSKVGNKLPVGTQPPTKITSYGAPSFSPIPPPTSNLPPPVNPELFASNNEAHSREFSSPIPPAQT